MHPTTGDLARNPGMCPGWELNQRPFGSQASSPLRHTGEREGRTCRNSVFADIIFVGTTVSHSYTLTCLLLRPEPASVGKLVCKCRSLSGLVSAATAQHLHLKAALLFSVSTGTLLNLPRHLSELNGGRFHVTLTWVKILGHDPFAYLGCSM